MTLPIFEPNETAVIHSTNSEWDDTSCKVVGLASTHTGNNNFYIIELTKPSKDGWTHTKLTNACLRKL
jgi:hypothetical protein